MTRSPWPGKGTDSKLHGTTVLHVRNDGSPCKCRVCTYVAPARTRDARMGGRSRASKGLRGPRAELVARGPSVGGGSEREQRDAAVAAMVDWLEPLPTALMVTVAPEPVYGAKGYAGLLYDVVEESAAAARVLAGQVGALAFTQQNARGGLHMHGLVYGPEALHELHRVSLARSLESRWRSGWHASWVGEQKVRVSVVACAGRRGLHGYVVRYAARDTQGDMIEAGEPLERWLPRVGPASGSAGDGRTGSGDIRGPAYRPAGLTQGTAA